MPPQRNKIKITRAKTAALWFIIIFLGGVALLPQSALADEAQPQSDPKTVVIQQGALTRVPGRPVVKVDFTFRYFPERTYPGERPDYDPYFFYECREGSEDRSDWGTIWPPSSWRRSMEPLGFSCSYILAGEPKTYGVTVGAFHREGSRARFYLARTAVTITVDESGNPTATPDAPPPPPDRPVGDSAGNKIGGILLQVVNWILGILFLIFHNIFKATMAYLIVPLLNAMLAMRAAEITGIVEQGWDIVRNITNLFFILALIVIGLATILRLESYNYKRLLGKLILMALLVNFSLVIGQAIIQLADVATNTFVSGNFSTGTELINKLEKLRGLGTEDFLLSPWDDNYAQSQFAVTIKVIFVVIMEVLLLVTFIALSAYLVIRVAALWVLLILSPLAYFFSIIPAFSGTASKWWSEFLKYAFFAPIMAFFIFLILNLKTDSISAIREFNGGSTPFNQVVKDNLQYVVIIVLLWIGMKTAMRMGVAGADGVMKFAKGVPKAGWGAAKAGGRLADRWTAGGALATAPPGAGKIRRGWAAVRRGTSYLSPSAVKAGVKATLEARKAKQEEGVAAATGNVQNLATRLARRARLVTREEGAVDHAKRARQARIAKKEAGIDTNDDKILKQKYQDHLKRGELEDAMAVGTRMMKNADFEKIIPAKVAKDFRGMRHVIEQGFKGLAENIKDDFAQELSEVAKSTSQPEFTRLTEGTYNTKIGKTEYKMKDNSQDAAIQNTIEKDVGKMSVFEIAKIRAASFENEWLAQAARANIPNTQRDVNQMSMVGTSMLLFKHGFDKALDENRGVTLRMLNKFAGMTDDQLKTTIDRALGAEWLATGSGPGGKSTGADYRDKIEVAISLKGVTGSEIDEYAEDLRNNRNWRLP